MRLISPQLEAFMEVAKTKSFSQAAKNLHVTQSALSQRIRKLELILEAAVFIRDRAGLRITPIGEGLLRYCRIQDGLEREFLGNLERKNTTELTGILRIAGFSSVMRSAVMPAVSDLLHKNSGVQIEFFTREIRDLPAMLSRGEADIVVSSAKAQKAGIESHLIGLEENVLVQPRVDVLRRNAFFDHDVDDDTTLSYLKLQRKKHSEIRREFLDEVYSIIEAVALGWGQAILPRHLIQKDARLAIVNSDKVLETPVFLQYFHQPYYSALHLGAINALVQQMPRFLKRTKPSLARRTHDLKTSVKAELLLKDLPKI